MSTRSTLFHDLSLASKLSDRVFPDFEILLKYEPKSLNSRFVNGDPEINFWLLVITYQFSNSKILHFYSLLSLKFYEIRIYFSNFYEYTIRKRVCVFL